jgi:hypothetical protein
VNKPPFDIWIQLARDCFMSRDTTKRIAYALMYGMESDPWLSVLVLKRLYELQEQSR